MEKRYTLSALGVILFAFVPFVSVAQRAQIGTYFTCDIPNKSIMPKMSTNAGLGLQFAYKPVQRIPLMIEFKGSLGMYSNRTLQQTYYFDSLNKTTTDVTYSSAMNRIGIGTKFYLVNDYRTVRPFITPQVGMAFMRSKIVVADPLDEDDCEALERKTTQRYSGFTYGGEAGVEVSMSHLFNINAEDNKHRLYASVTFMNSFNRFEYVNVKYMKDHDHAAMTSGTGGTSTADGDRDINGKFINVSTNSIHEHKIAELYNTNLQFWGFNIGYTFNF
ncbi:MAG TPA: hypothetical protein VK151_16890 [Fluviicola sp.]|nr:hypothetical protein [Fluviicola sp.]